MTRMMRFMLSYICVGAYACVFVCVCDPYANAISTVLPRDIIWMYWFSSATRTNRWTVSVSLFSMSAVRSLVGRSRSLAQYKGTEEGGKGQGLSRMAAALELEFVIIKHWESLTIWFVILQKKKTCCLRRWVPVSSILLRNKVGKNR